MSVTGSLNPIFSPAGAPPRPGSGATNPQLCRSMGALRFAQITADLGVTNDIFVALARVQRDRRDPDAGSRTWLSYHQPSQLHPTWPYLLFVVVRSSRFHLPNHTVDQHHHS